MLSTKIPIPQIIERILFFLLYALFPVYAVGRAWKSAWVCDDAFISFRYALNLIRGEGLVFNAGERVEGYTNFLWTILIAPFTAAGYDPMDVSVILGIVCFILLFLILFFYGGELGGGARLNIQRISLQDFFRNPALSFSWSLLFVSIHRHLGLFATSGLETSLFTFCITAGFLFLCRELRAEENIAGAGRIGMAILTAACLTRPDGLLVYGICSIGLFLRDYFLIQKKSKKIACTTLLHAILRINIVFIIIYIPYWLIRYFYYGMPFPNTFYAKSAYDSYFHQGLIYTMMYFKSYWILLFLPMLILLRFFLSGKLKPKTESSADRTAVLIAYAILIFFTAYIIYVGGDFMFSRFFIPITPIIFLLLERNLRLLLPTGYASEIENIKFNWKMLAAPLLVIAGIAAYYDIYRGRDLPIVNDVSEENRIYSIAGMRKVMEDIRPAKESIRRSGAVVAFMGAQAFVIYFWDPETAIEAETGLTDREVAGRKLTKRGRVGHDKNADYEYLMRRNVSFILRPPPPERNFGFNLLRIDGLSGEFEIINYIPDVMNELKKNPRFHFQDFSEYSESLPDEKEKFLQNYYYRHLR